MLIRRSWVSHALTLHMHDARLPGIAQVIPVENVDGRQAWEAGNLCLRKTAHGVDLNRNYPFGFASEVRPEQRVAVRGGAAGSALTASGMPRPGARCTVHTRSSATHASSGVCALTETSATRMRDAPT